MNWIVPWAFAMGLITGWLWCRIYQIWRERK